MIIFVNPTANHNKSSPTARRRNIGHAPPCVSRRWTGSARGVSCVSRGWSFRPDLLAVARDLVDKPRWAGLVVLKPISRPPAWPTLSLSGTWKVLEDMDYGDHRLVTIEMDIKIPEIPRRRYRTQNTSFKKFNKLLTSYIIEDTIEFNSILTINEFDTMYQKFLR